MSAKLTLKKKTYFLLPSSRKAHTVGNFKFSV